jgi:hypothetical protein
MLPSDESATKTGELRERVSEGFGFWIWNYVTGALHGTKRRLNLGRGSATSPSTAPNTRGQRAATIFKLRAGQGQGLAQARAHEGGEPQ